jgi:hypothetical protein
MPKLSKNIITYDSEDWLAGLHTQHYSSSLDFMPMGDKGFSFMQATDPYNYVGCLTAGPNRTDATNASAVMTSYIKQGINTGQKAFLIEDTKLHYLDVPSKTLLNDSAGVGYPHTIAAHAGHNSVVSSDIVFYNHKVGGVSALRGVYSWVDNTDWDVGTFDLATSGSATFDDDFMTTAPATPLDITSAYEAGKSYPHPMIVGYDDILYIADRNFVHAYDGQSSADDDGKFYPEALVLPKEYTIYGFAKLAPRSLAIFASTTTPILYQSSSKVTVFIWNYLDLDPDYIKDIPENMVTAPFEYNGTVGCFAYGRIKNYVGLYLLNGSSGQFERVSKFYGYGVVLINGGVNIIGNEIRWLCGGRLFSYGNQFDQQLVLNQFGRVDYSGYGHGMFKRFSDSNGDFVSTDTKNLEYLSGYDNSNGTFYTTFFPTDKIRIKKIKVYFAQTCSGIGFELSVGSYNDTEYEVIDIDSIGVDDLVMVNYGLDTAGAKIPVLNGLYLHGKFTGGTGISDAPVLRKIEIEFESPEFI